MGAALLLNALRAVRGTSRPAALSVRHLDRDDDRLILELSVSGSAHRVRVQRISLDSRFAARVLAQPPEGFGRRLPARSGTTITWVGQTHVRHGVPMTMTVPMRTDIAATGSFTFLYTYRRGIVKRTARTAVDYRPLLVAVGA